MARRIGVQQRVAANVAISVEILWIRLLRHHRIRADKPPQPRVVVAGVVIHQAKAPLRPLAGEGEVGDQGAGDPALLAIGQVAGFGHHRAGDISC
jgi:hypothetical protein